MPPVPDSLTGAPSATSGARLHRAWILVPGLLALAGIAVAVIVLLGTFGSNAGATYRHKLSTALAPVVSSTTALSGSLESLQGSNASAATTAANQTQQALVAARGAVDILTVPSGSSQFSQQVRQALTQESGYVQAVSATLSSPSTQNIAQLQPLATTVQSTLVPLKSIAPGLSTSLSGTDKLSSWASARVAAAAKASAAQQRADQQHAIQQAASLAAQRAQPPAPPESRLSVVPGTVTGTDGAGHNIGNGCSDNPADPLPGCNDGNGRGPASNLSFGSVTGADSAGYNTGVGCSDNPSVSLPTCLN
jgi:hypothetical protein